MKKPITSDNYLQRVIKQNKLKPISLNDRRVRPILKIIQEWGGGNIATITPSGSTAKGTAIKGSADLDVFISLKSSTPGTLGNIYDSLFRHFGKYTKIGLKRRRQNVSVRIFFEGLEIDLVPGKKIAGNHVWHSLHVRRDVKIWTQTNIINHIRIIKNSGRTDEILLTKLWRDKMGLEFPSIYLELSVIKALRGKHKGHLANNFLHVLTYLSTKGQFTRSSILDPFNGANRISSLITAADKRKIAMAANNSIIAVPDWKYIFG